MKSTKKPQEAHKATAEAEQQEARELMQSLLAADDLQQAIRELPFDKIYLIYAADQADADPDKIKAIIIATDEKLLREGTPELLLGTKSIVLKQLTRIAESAASPGRREAAAQLREATEYLLYKNYPTMEGTFIDFGETVKYWAASFQEFKETHTEKAQKDIIELERYISVILFEAGRDNPDFAQFKHLAKYSTLQICATGFTKTGKPIKGGKFEKLIKAAIEARDSYLQAREQTEAAKIIAKPTRNIEYPIDKPNTEIWRGLQGVNYDSQLQLATVAIDTTAGDNSGEVAVIYGISFSELDKLEKNNTVLRKLTEYDKLVYLYTAALYNAGNATITPTRLYKEMTRKDGKPSKKDIEKITLSLVKMSMAWIHLDPTQEASVYTGYSAVKPYTGSLLPLHFNGDPTIINGKMVDAPINIHIEPPLMTFAKQRKQIDTLQKKVLQAPISKTETALKIQDYLITRICRIKKGNGQPKILYDTLFSNCNITAKEKTKRSRAKETVKILLNWYVECDFINSYREESDGIKIFVSQATANKK